MSNIDDVIRDFSKEKEEQIKAAFRECDTYNNDNSKFERMIDSLCGDKEVGENFDGLLSHHKNMVEKKYRNMDSISTIFSNAREVDGKYARRIDNIDEDVYDFRIRILDYARMMISGDEFEAPIFSLNKNEFITRLGMVTQASQTRMIQYYKDKIYMTVKDDNGNETKAYDWEYYKYMLSMNAEDVPDEYYQAMMELILENEEIVEKDRKKVNEVFGKMISYAYCDINTDTWSDQLVELRLSPVYLELVNRMESQLPLLCNYMISAHQSNDSILENKYNEYISKFHLFQAVERYCPSIEVSRDLALVTNTEQYIGYYDYDIAKTDLRTDNVKLDGDVYRRYEIDYDKIAPIQIVIDTASNEDYAYRVEVQKSQAKRWLNVIDDTETCDFVAYGYSYDKQLDSEIRDFRNMATKELLNNMKKKNTDVAKESLEGSLGSISRVYLAYSTLKNKLSEQDLSSEECELLSEWLSGKRELSSFNLNEIKTIRGALEKTGAIEGYLSSDVESVHINCFNTVIEFLDTKGLDGTDPVSHYLINLPENVIQSIKKMDEDVAKNQIINAKYDMIINNIDVNENNLLQRIAPDIGIATNVYLNKNGTISFENVQYIDKSLGQRRLDYYYYFNQNCERRYSIDEIVNEAMTGVSINEFDDSITSLQRDAMGFSKYIDSNATYETEADSAIMNVYERLGYSVSKVDTLTSEQVNDVLKCIDSYTSHDTNKNIETILELSNKDSLMYNEEKFSQIFGKL